MNELSFEYLNKIAEQIVTISSLLGGFSIAVIANIIISETNTRITKYLLVSSSLAACFFLVTIFTMTNLLMKTSSGYPLPIDDGDLKLPRLVGIVFFFLGTISLISLISLAGWTKSKKMGIFTAVAGLITLVLTLMMMSI